MRKLCVCCVSPNLRQVLWSVNDCLIFKACCRILCKRKANKAYVVEFDSKTIADGQNLFLADCVYDWNGDCLIV